jgi:hypothetical protein
MLQGEPVPAGGEWTQMEAVKFETTLESLVYIGLPGARFVLVAFISSVACKEHQGYGAIVHKSTAAFTNYDPIIDNKKNMNTELTVVCKRL